MSALEKIIALARQKNCSDIHLTMGRPPAFRENGRLMLWDNVHLSFEAILEELINEHQRKMALSGESVDFMYADAQNARCRVNVYRTQEGICAAIRLLQEKVPTLASLGMPSVIQKLAMVPNGLILVTGPTGSGKSTTLAAMVNAINQSCAKHILTIEDPIEYRHANQKSIVHQREIGRDAHSFKAALHAALREDPDVILVGEMRDSETIEAAITAAETGHLVLSTLHTRSAVNTISRIIDAFPPEKHRQIRGQLASLLRGVITQQLIPMSGNRVAALEILCVNSAVANLIRSDKLAQVFSIMQMGHQEGMQTMEWQLAEWVKNGLISLETAAAAVNDEEMLMQYIENR